MVKDIVDIATQNAPDVMIVDLNMTDDTFGAITKARAAAPSTKIIALTSLANVNTVVRALDAGTSGYVLSTSDPSELVHAVEAVRRGETYIASGLAEPGDHAVEEPLIPTSRRSCKIQRP